MKINNLCAILTDDTTENVSSIKAQIKDFIKFDDYIHYFRDMSIEYAADPDLSFFYADIYETLRFASQLGGNISNIEVKKHSITITLKFVNITDFLQFYTDLDDVVRKNVGYSL